MDMGLAARADRSESKIGRFDAALFRVETPESNMSTRSSAAVSLSCSDFRKAAEKYRRRCGALGCGHPDCRSAVEQPTTNSILAIH